MVRYWVCNFRNVDKAEIVALLFREYLLACTSSVRSSGPEPFHVKWRKRCRGVLHQLAAAAWSCYRRWVGFWQWAKLRKDYKKWWNLSIRGRVQGKQNQLIMRFIGAECTTCINKGYWGNFPGGGRSSGPFIESYSY